MGPLQSDSFYSNEPTHLLAGAWPLNTQYEHLMQRFRAMPAYIYR